MITATKRVLSLISIQALLFTGLQIFEYYDAPFTISVGVFGSCFYLTTGFHGFYVFVGTISIFVHKFVANITQW